MTNMVTGISMKWTREYRMKLLDKIEGYRLSKSMSIVQISKELNLPWNTYHRWIRGEMLLGRIWAYKLNNF